MKKLIYIISLMLFNTFGVNNAKAILPDFTPLIPVAPQFCAMCTPSAISEVVTIVGQVKEMKNKYTGSSVMSMVKQAALQYGTELGKTKFNSMKQKMSAQKKVISYSRTIEECSIADINDENSVKTAFIELFLQYPSKKNTVKKKYKDKGDQFKMDTTLEMFITAREMDKELRTMLVELDNIEKCLVAGEDCSQSGMEQYNCQGGSDGKQDELCIMRNALNAVRIYDKIMRYNEYLLAMNIQANAVRSIDTSVKIKPFEDKTSSLFDKELNSPQKIASVGVETTIMSASANVDDFEEITDVNMTFPLEGKEADYESLEEILEVQKMLKTAASAHNLKRNLPKYKNTFATYNKLKNYHQQTIDYLQISEKCVAGYMNKYYSNSNMSWIGENCHFNDSSIYCHYNPEKKVESTEKSKGEYDIACPDDSSYKCYIKDVNDYASRGGISGWLLELYSQSKSEEANEDIDSYSVGEIDEDASRNDVAISRNNNSSSTEERMAKLEENQSGYDDYVTEADGDKTSIKSVSALKAQGGSSGSSYLSDNETKNLKKISKEDEIKAENRKNDLKNWTIGQQVSKAIAKDLAGNVGGNGNFGAVNKSFPIWNDQKNFYNQYIQNKYENIKNYIRNMSMTDMVLGAAIDINAGTGYEDTLDEEGEIIESGESKRLAIENGLISLSNEFSHNIANDYSSELTRIITDEKSSYEKILNEHKSKMASLENQKKNIYAQIETTNTEISTINEKVNSNNETVDNAEAATTGSEEALDYSKDLYKEREVSKPSPQDGSFNENIAENEKNSSAAIKEKTSSIVTLDKLKRNLEVLQNKLKSTKEEIVQERARYVKEYSDMQNSYGGKIASAISNIKYTTSLEDSVISRGGYYNVFGLAQGVKSAVKETLISYVEEAQNKLEQLKSANNSLYIASNIDAVTAIHTEMINKLTNFNVADVIARHSLSSQQKSGVLRFANAFTSICQSVSCYAPDEQYFVGIVAKSADFASPKAAPDFGFAPLREIFHFDTVDYANIDKYIDGDQYKIPAENSKVTTIAPAILSSGLEIPEIWQYILQYRPFVEQDIDLEALLNAGKNEATVQMRSGIYPCITGNAVIDVVPGSGNEEASYITTSLSGASSAGYQIINTSDVYSGVCQNISLKGSGYSTIRDIEADAAISAKSGETSKSGIGASELGNILEIITSNDTIDVGHIFDGIKIGTSKRLTFRSSLQKAVNNISNHNPDSSGKTDSSDAVFQIYDRSMFRTNQFGNYLDNVEQEEMATEILANTKIQIDELRKNLNEAFEDYGYTLSEDFDLTNSEDYELAANTLDMIKNNKIRAAKDKMNENIKGITNALAVKKQSAQHIIDLLEKDSSELVSLIGTEDLNELEEKIKNEQADNAIVKEYEDEGDSALDKMIKDLKTPYCSIYPAQ